MYKDGQTTPMFDGEFWNNMNEKKIGLDDIKSSNLNTEKIHSSITTVNDWRAGVQI